MEEEYYYQYDTPEGEDAHADHGQKDGGLEQTDPSIKTGFEKTDDQISDIYGHTNGSDHEEETNMKKDDNITIGTETDYNYKIGSEDKEKFTKNSQLKKNISNIVKAINTKVKSLENFVSDIALFIEATAHENVQNTENNEEQEEGKEPERNNPGNWFTSHAQHLMFVSTNSLIKCFVFYVLKYIIFY